MKELLLLFLLSEQKGLAVASIARDVGSSSTNIMH